MISVALAFALGYVLLGRRRNRGIEALYFAEVGFAGWFVCTAAMLLRPSGTGAARLRALVTWTRPDNDYVVLFLPPFLLLAVLLWTVPLLSGGRRGRLWWLGCAASCALLPLIPYVPAAILPQLICAFWYIRSMTPRAEPPAG